jgi:hypothetical protein
VISRLPRLGALLLLCGCQYVSGANDLEIAEPSVGPDWICLGQSTPRVVSGTVSYEGPVRDLATFRILDDVVVRFCQSGDEPCASPVLTVTPINGSIAFTIDATFDGYVELESPGMVPALIELSRPIGAMRTLSELRMVDAATLGAFANQLNASVDAALGHALFWAQDCAGQRAPGVSVEALGELSPSARSYYVVDFKLPSDTVDQTDVSGGGGFINLPAKGMTFDARRASTGELISRLPGRIRPGQVTFLPIEPD